MWPLAFLAPGFLLGALAAVVPLVLHLRRREAAPPVAFSAVRFLRRAPVARLRPRRLADLLLLALRVAGIGLLAVAFARPYRTATAGGETGLTVVAVDTSFSMGAPGQMARARALARRAIADAPAAHRMALLTFDEATAVVVEPTSDRRAALAAVERLEAGFGATRYRQALGAAGMLIGGGPGRIVLVTDSQRAGWDGDDEGVVPEQVRVDIVDVGMPSGNLAVTAVHPEPAATRATVLNAGAAPRSVRATVSTAGRTLATVDQTAPPGRAIDLRFPVGLPQAGGAAVTVEDPEGPVADNTRYVVLDPPRPLRVTLVTTTGATSREALYLERALLAGDDARRVVLDGVAASAVGTLPVEMLHGADTIVLMGTRGLEPKGQARLAAYLRQGGGLVVVAGPFVERTAVVEILGTPGESAESSEQTGTAVALVPVDLRHPVFRPFASIAANLGQVRFRRTRQLVQVADGTVVARFTDGRAALVEYRRGRGRALVFGSDLNNEWNDFPLHPTFAPFVHELVGSLAGSRPLRREWLVGAVPAGVPPKPGLVRLTSTGEWVAVNVDPRESDLTRMNPDEVSRLIAQLKRPTSHQAARSRVDQEARQQLWWYILVATLLVLAAESLVGRWAT